MNERNPKDFKPGEHVEVVNPDHAQFGKRGTIHELLGVVIEHGKPRASIKLDAIFGPGFIFVSLPNLERIEADESGPTGGSVPPGEAPRSDDTR